MAIERELPLALVRCVCTSYVVSMLHAVPLCPECGLTPWFERETNLCLSLDDVT